MLVDFAKLLVLYSDYFLIFAPYYYYQTVKDMKKRQLTLIMLTALPIGMPAQNSNKDNEPNNTWQQASEITNGSTVTGRLGDDGDNVDCYKIVVPDDGIVTIKQHSEAITITTIQITLTGTG